MEGREPSEERKEAEIYIKRKDEKTFKNMRKEESRGAGGGTKRGRME